MATLNTILKEIKDVPVDRLEEVRDKSPDGKQKKDLLSFSGILSDWSEEEYQDFVKHTQKVRKELFNRKLDI